MNVLQSFFFFAVSLGASVVGAICGIGGGVIIKPVLDGFGWASVSTISFLSGCTVLAMSCYSVLKAMQARESLVRLRTGTPLAIGAAVGGVAGKQLFSAVKAAFASPNTVGAVQAVCLLIITLCVLVYTLNKSRVRAHRVSGTVPCLVIGLALGVLSSFLGIGGGPINLMVLYFFFEMDTKTAAANSLYIILFSQAASLLMTLITRTVPEFNGMALVLMASGGILGGMMGRKLNRRLDNAAVDKLFVALMVVIMAVCVFNAWRYSIA